MKTPIRLLNQKSLGKLEAHKFNINLWRRLTGRQFLNPDEQYWTLLHSPSQSKELETLTEPGNEFIKGNHQFHGVNNNILIIEEFKKAHSGVNTYHGMWNDCICKFTPCKNGGMVYVDTMNEYDGKGSIAATTILYTMRRVGPGTLICGNLCAESVYRGKPKSGEPFMEHILQGMRNNHGWYLIVFDAKDNPIQLPLYDVGKTHQDHKDCYKYTSNVIQMATCFFWRPK